MAPLGTRSRGRAQDPRNWEPLFACNLIFGRRNQGAIRGPLEKAARFLLTCVCVCANLCA